MTPYHLDPARLREATTLAQLELALHFAATAVSLLTLWFVLRTGFAARLAECVAVLRSDWQRRVIYFTLLITTLSLPQLPLDVAAHQLAVSFGISVEGWLPWTVDLLKVFALSLVFGVPLLWLLAVLIRKSPRRYWLFAWCLSVPLTLAVTFLLPPIIEPLFNHYEPLAATHPQLAAALEQVAARTGTEIPVHRIFLMRAADRTNGLNAYVTGLGATKRIVVWDTTADRIPIDQAQFIFAHETGHYVLHHIAKGLATSAVLTLILFFVTARFAAWMLARFGAHWRVAELSTNSGIVVILFAAAIVQIPTEPIGNTISRHFEHEADIYGQEAMRGIVPNPQQTAVAAFQSLGEAWLEDPAPNAFVVFWTSSHPSTAQRAAFAAEYNPQHPRFFPAN